MVRQASVFPRVSISHRLSARRRKNFSAGARTKVLASAWPTTPVGGGARRDKAAGCATSGPGVLRRDIGIHLIQVIKRPTADVVRLRSLAVHGPDGQGLRSPPQVFGAVAAVHPAVRDHANAYALYPSLRPPDPPAASC